VSLSLKVILYTPGSVLPSDFEPGDSPKWPSFLFIHFSARFVLKVFSDHRMVLVRTIVNPPFSIVLLPPKIKTGFRQRIFPPFFRFPLLFLFCPCSLSRFSHGFLSAPIDLSSLFFVVFLKLFSSLSFSGVSPSVVVLKCPSFGPVRMSFFLFTPRTLLFFPD